MNLMQLFFKLMAVIIVGVAVVVVVYGFYSDARSDNSLAVYILDTRDSVSVASESATALDGSKVMVTRVNSLVALLQMINSRIGSDETQCLQKIWDASTDSVGFLIENSGLLVKAHQIEVITKNALKQLDEADLSDARIVGEIGNEHGKKVTEILSGMAVALEPINELAGCSQRVSGWLIVKRPSNPVQ